MSDEQYQELSGRCELLLHAALPIIFVVFWELFKREPSNQDLLGFRALLQEMHAVKGGNVKKGDIKVMRVIEETKGRL